MMAVAIGRQVLLALGLASAVSGSPPVEPSSALASEELTKLFGIPQPHVKGVPSFIKFQDPMPELLRRDCLGNGTNYCFNNNANYCANCGTCCTAASSRYCCPADGMCCGSACCGKGQKCNDGQCFQPPVTVTVASTVLKTVTHSRTQVNTVATTIFLTTTVNTVIESTITSIGATETNWQYVTVTTSIENTNSKRSFPSATPEDSNEDVEQASPDAIETGRALDAEKRQLGARQEPSRSVAAVTPSTVTVETMVTQNKDVTNIITTEVASTKTSTVLTTITQTKTKILSAQSTISPISTITITIRPPSTTYQTIIQTAIVDPTPNPSSTDPALQTESPAPSPMGLSTPTIAGIGAGAAIFAVVLALGIYFLVRRRRAAAARKQAYEDACVGLHVDDAYVGPGYRHMSLPPPAHPTLPVVDGDIDGAVGAHKGSFTTTGSTAASTTPHSTMQGRFPHRPGHHRSSSSFTGSTAVTNNVGVKRASDVSGRSAAGGTPPAELGEQQQQRPYLQEATGQPAEMMATNETARYEAPGAGATWFGGNVDGVSAHDPGRQGGTQGGGSGSPLGNNPPRYRDF